MAAHLLGHTLQGEGDVRISLLERAIQHMETTALWSVYYGNGRDSCDVWGRTAHESIFNISDGAYRCPNSQQGFSGFTTWTRGLAWAMLGCAEELELLQHITEKDMEQLGTRHKIENTMVQAARATCDFYIENTTKDGIPFWDAGALNLHRLTNYKHHLSDPFNDWEPVDSSAAAIGAQALLRLGNFLKKNNEGDAEKYWQAGLTVADTLLNPPYLSTDPGHQGLLLHSIYHHPNGWDYIPEGKKIPCGESSMWGDYHLREMALYLQRFINNEPYYTFFNGLI
ncbi:MAG: hypothetical protein CSA36_00110 [Draconibacterium sp.]|nr:MAG: hypothetical protein CSA36_00110 [Draconibacterium sp.]